MDEQIVAVIRLLERRYLTVYPYQVAMVIQFSERMMRNKMHRLAMDGMLVRIGNRGGYLTVERVANRHDDLVRDMAQAMASRRGANKAVSIAKMRVEDALNGAFFICR